MRLARQSRAFGAEQRIGADDHPLFRGALRQSLAASFTSLEIKEAGSLEEVTGELEHRGEADLILLDLSMPGMRGFSGLMYLRAQYPGVPVVIVSASDDPATIRRCLGLGALGFIPKSLGAEAIRDAVRQVLAGEVWTPPDLPLDEPDDQTDAVVQRLATLTPQQVRVLMMLSEGLLNKQIAYELGVSEATVKAHVSAILQKLGVDSRTQAVIAASKIEAGQWQSLKARVG
jgi:DNA-binding NarL/FixJ family response regulator